MHKKIKFSIKDLQFPADLVTFTEEILNGKLHFVCIGRSMYSLVLRKSAILKTHRKMFIVERNFSKAEAAGPKPVTCSKKRFAILTLSFLSDCI